MARNAHPHAMAPSKPGRTRTAPPQLPDKFPMGGRYLAYTLFDWTGLVYLLMGFMILSDVWSLGSGEAFSVSPSRSVNAAPKVSLNNGSTWLLIMAINLARALAPLVDPNPDSLTAKSNAFPPSVLVAIGANSFNCDTASLSPGSAASALFNVVNVSPLADASAVASFTAFAICGLNCNCDLSLPFSLPAAKVSSVSAIFAAVPCADIVWTAEPIALASNPALTLFAIT